jgi:Domain of unknown function (DUF5063)
LSSAEWEAFRSAAERFCSLLETSGEHSVEGLLEQLEERLAEIYWSASRLRPPFDDSRAPEPLPHDVPRKIGDRLRQALGEDEYRFVFSPWEDTEVVESTLAQDLSEIYYDLKESLRDVRGEDAMWDSRWAFEHHWGRHALQALHAVHWLNHP